MKIVTILKRGVLSLKGNYLTVLPALSILLAVLVVYWQDLSILLNEALQSEATGHIIIVPLLVSYLLYRKKESVEASLELEELQRKRLVSASDFVGAALCLTAFLVYWYGSYTFYPVEYHIASLLMFIIGATLILTSAKALMILLFPILFLAFLVPPPSTVVYTAGGLLASINTQGSYILLKTAGLPVLLSYNYGAPVIALSTSTRLIEFGVYQASSGLYSLIAFTMFATFLAYITKGPATKKAALFILGLAILPVLNITRISIIVSAAYWLGEDIAMNVFHTFTGWLLIFGGVLLLLVIGEKILHLQILERSKKNVSCSECENVLKKHESFCESCGKFLKTTHSRISKVFWAKLTVLLITSCLVMTSIQAPAFSFASGLTFTNSNPQENTNVFPNITGYQLQYAGRDEAYERIAHQDANFIYIYKLPNDTTPRDSTPWIFVIAAVASSVSNLHNWEVSLSAWQISQGLPPVISIIDSGDTQLTENPRIIAHYLVFQYTNQSSQISSIYTHVVLYWYLRASFKMGLTVEPRYVRINLLILTENPNEYSQLKEELKSIGQKIALHWEPLKVKSLISLGIPMMQVLLGSAILAAVFVQISQYALDQRKKRTNLKIFEKLASPEERKLYQTVKELSLKTREMTVTNIALALQRTTGKEVKLDELNDRLKNLEKHGLAKRDIVIILDEPRLVWKT